MKRFILLCCLLCVSCTKTPITGKNVFIVTSEEEEAKLGEEAYRQELSKGIVSKDLRWNTITQRVAQRIAAVSEKPDYAWEFKVIESQDANAFCLPGGKIAVYSGILSHFKNEAEFATVMGHEIAHAIARHAGQRITLQFGSEISFSFLQLLLGGGENAEQKNLLLAALGLGATVGVQLPFSRSNELEADYIGLILMSKAGYDPKYSVDFWDRFGKNGPTPPTFLSTHPNPETRRDKLQENTQVAEEYYQKSSRYGEGEVFTLSLP